MRILRMILILSMLFAGGSKTPTQETPEVLPKLVQHAQPVYPQLARQARVQGDVIVQITTDGESVIEAKAESGPELLRKAAEDCAISWKFAAHMAGTFHVTFRYKLGDGNIVAVFPETSSVVQIIEARQPEMDVYYSWLDLGKWEAQLKSAHGAAVRSFQFRYSGPCEDWLEGSSVGPNGRKEEIDYGHKEGNFLIFDMRITAPDGKRLKTYFVGRMAGDKITGTFVDDAGINGEWTAKRQRKR
jgi:hypothetical protein